MSRNCSEIPFPHTSTAVMYGSAMRPDACPSVYLSSLKKRSPMARETERESTCGLILGWPRRPRQTRPPAVEIRAASDSLLFRWCTSVRARKLVAPELSRVPRRTSLSPTLPTMQRPRVRSSRATAAVVPSISSSDLASASHSSSSCPKARRKASTGSVRRVRRSPARMSQRRSPQNSAARAPPCPSNTAKYERLPRGASAGGGVPEPLGVAAPLGASDCEGEVAEPRLMGRLLPSTPRTAWCASSISGRKFWMEWTPYRTGLPKDTALVRVRLPERRPLE
mmetsp:Transcript_92641/g.276282  ORF Transcript_92641/g.276282 Transcript_92641/m.276282 type:complete len:281 (+) Transcript_92641:363-1205(+)